MIAGEINIFPERFQSLESVLVASQICYEKALSFDPKDKDRENLLKRLGNIQNELGVLYMNQVSCKYILIARNNFTLALQFVFRLSGRKTQPFRTMGVKQSYRAR